MNFAKPIANRVASAVPSVAGVIVATFLLSHALPGDPAAFFAGPAANSESVAQIRHQLGLDRSLPVQFIGYLRDLLHGDLGHSVTSGQPVLDDLVNRLPASIELTAVALLFAVALALPLGILAAVRPGSPVDHACRAFVSVGAAFPTFFVGLLLVYIFYYLLGWAPAPLGRLDETYFSAPREITGFYLIDALVTGDAEAFRGAAAQIVLPAVSLGLFALAPIARITRASMLAALDSDFVRTARAMGLSGGKIIVTYALKNAMLQIVNILGMVFSFLLGANVLVEQVFGWPGIGAYAVNAVIASDYAAIQGFVLLMAILYILLNLAVDIASTLIDPRVRYDG